MRDELLDLIEHTHSLGCVELIKITGTDTETAIEGVADDRSVIIQAKFHKPISEFVGTFGMPTMSSLKTIFGISEYDEGAKITVQHDDVKGPVSMKFENAAGDFTNDYRFMVKEIVEGLLKTVKFKGVKWNVTFEPSVIAIQRLKFQRAVSDDPTFLMKTENGELNVMFGDPSTHAGKFVFEKNIEGEIKEPYHWPVDRIISILDLSGDKVFQVSDDGAAQIIVDSGIAEYTYILPAHTK